MARLLPSDFEGEKYGLHYRLVNEGDAEFIYKLRSNETLSKYIHDIKGGVENQIEWIRNYKVREEEGSDYYFIFLHNDNPVGLARIYSIHDKTYTSGSWVMVTNSPIEHIVATAVINRDIAFDTLGFTFEDNYDACHVDNKKVIKFNKMFGCKIYKHFQDVKGKYVAMSLTKEDYYANRPKMLKMIGY